MKVPDIVDIVIDLSNSINNVETDDTEFGDEANENVVIPVITDLFATVEYYNTPIALTPLARIIWSWSAPVITDEDGVPVDPNDPDITDDINFDPVVDYLFGTGIGAGVPPTRWASTNNRRTIKTDGHALNTDITGSVRAVHKSGILGPIASLTVEVQRDTTPPPKPSAPVLSSELLIVSVAIDGKDEFGVDMPGDLLQMEIVAGTTNPPTELKGTIERSGTFVFQGIRGQTVYVQVFARDHSRNRSIGSDIVSVVVRSVLDDTDLEEQLATKSDIYHQDEEPTDPKEGDWWYTKTTGWIYRYEDGDWTVIRIGSNSIENGAVGLDHLTAAVVNVINEANTNANTALATANGKGRNIYTTAALINNYTPFTVHDTWWDTGDDYRMRSWNGTAWVSGAFGTDAIANLAITNAKISALDAGKITTGLLNAARIGANTITANKLVLADINNYITDGMFLFHDAGVPRAWTGGGTIFSEATYNYMRVNSPVGVSAYCYAVDYFDTAEGTQYYAEFESFAYPATTLPNTYLQLMFYNGAGVAFAYSGIYVTAAEHAAAGNWVKKSGVLTAPAGAVRMRAVLTVGPQSSISNTAIFRNIKVYKRNAGELIVDGSITANKIAALTIGTNQLAALAVTTIKLAANSVVADKIATDAIIARHIKAGEVTTDAIRAGAITASLLTVNQAMIDALTVDGTLWANKINTGMLTIGDFLNYFRDGQTNPNVTFAAWTKTATYFQKAGTDAQHGAYSPGTDIYASPGESFRFTATRTNAAGSTGRASVYVQHINAAGSLVTTTKAVALDVAGVSTGTATVAAGANRLRVGLYTEADMPSGTTVRISDIQILRMSTGALIVDGAIDGKTITGVIINGGTINGGIVNSEDGLIVENSGSIRLNTSSGYVRLTGTFISGNGNTLSIVGSGGVYVSGGTNAWVNAVGGFYTSSGDYSTGSGYFYAPGTINPSTFGRAAIGMATTTTAANVYSSSNASALQRVSSLRHLKLDREELPVNYGILDLMPMSWRDRGEVESNPDTTHRIAGFVAEDVAVVSAFYNHAFDYLLTTDENEDLQGLTYDRFVAPLWPVVRDMHRRLQILEGSQQ